MVGKQPDGSVGQKKMAKIRRRFAMKLFNEMFSLKRFKSTNPLIKPINNSTITFQLNEREYFQQVGQQSLMNRLLMAVEAMC